MWDLLLSAVRTDRKPYFVGLLPVWYCSSWILMFFMLEKTFKLVKSNNQTNFRVTCQFLKAVFDFHTLFVIEKDITMYKETRI